jgi:hypothetical protein
VTVAGISTATEDGRFTPEYAGSGGPADKASDRRAAAADALAIDGKYRRLPEVAS